VAQVRHTVTAPGKEPVEFFAPEGASDADLQQLASQALASTFPQETFVTPVLDAATRKSLERAPAKLTQDEILSRQGDLTAPEPTLADAAVDRIRETLVGWGMDPYAAQREASNIASGASFLPGPGTAVAFDDARIAAKEGRYGAAAGNALAGLLDVAPGVGKGASALAMFLGRNAKTANLDLLRKAEQMAEQGADPGRILRETGWFKQHGDWKYEISDQPLKLNMENLPKWGEKVPLRNVVSHPELEAAYPEEFAAVKFQKETNPEYGGSWNDHEGVLRSKYLSDEQMRSITAHELQHFVQDNEGFARGGTVPRAEPDLTDPEYLKLKPEWERLSAEYNRLRTPGPDYDLEASDAIGDQVEDVWGQMELASNKPRYMDVAGEVEARNVQARLRGSEDQRRLRAPWSTQEVPDHLQVVTRRDGIAPISADPPGTVPTESVFKAYTDESGQPLRLYHGGDQQIHEVRSDWYGDDRGMNMFPNSFFMTPDREMAATYGDEITEAHAQITNPYVVDSADKWEFLERFEDPAPELKKMGYDGAIIKADDGGPDEFVIFDPKQFRRASSR
jgi:hypothetical protein